MINLPDFYLPVYAVLEKNGNNHVQEIYGTASYIGNNKFITTGHSIRNAKSNGILAIGHTDKNLNIVYLKSQREELIETLDIGIIEVSDEVPQSIASYMILTNKCLLLQDVTTSGYPHAYDREINKINYRALKGYIVCGRYFNHKDFPSCPSIYEISFHCPEGISGAPLILSRPDQGDGIIGYIVGNTNSEMVVFSMRETEKESGTERIYEKTSTTTYGIALGIENLLEIKMKILGDKTFYEYFKENNLV